MVSAPRARNVSLPPASQPMVDARGYATAGLRHWLEGIQGRVGGSVDVAGIAYAAAREAAAVGSLTGVAAVADAAFAMAALVGSFPVGVTLTGLAAGPKVSIGGHTRTYMAGQAPVTVTGGEVSGLAHATRYWIYYDQTSRAGGAVTYQAGATYTTAFPTQANPHRHFVGVITTPATSGSASTAGSAALPPGYVG